MLRAVPIHSLPNSIQAATMVRRLDQQPCPVTPSLVDKPFALYGNGNMGRLALQHLRAVGHEPSLIFERDQQISTKLGVAVCIVTAPYVPIEQDLLRRGFQTVVPFYDVAENFRHLHPLSNGWFSSRFSNIDKVKIDTVMTQWGDAVSRAHHLQFMAWRRVREEWVFDDAPVSKHPRYFIPEVTSVLHDHEVFIDGGAHHGTVSLAFIQQVKDKFNLILAIEPDKINRATYAEMLGYGKHVGVYSCALAEHAGIANFHGGLGYASQLSPTGHEYAITYP